MNGSEVGQAEQRPSNDWVDGSLGTFSEFRLGFSSLGGN